MAELTFTYGTMAAGKSTLALQLCWQLRQGGRDVALWTFGDRSATGTVTSRIGIESDADDALHGAVVGARADCELDAGRDRLVHNVVHPRSQGNLLSVDEVVKNFFLSSVDLRRHCASNKLVRRDIPCDSNYAKDSQFKSI